MSKVEVEEPCSDPRCLPALILKRPHSHVAEPELLVRPEDRLREPESGGEA